MSDAETVDAIVARLQLIPHPEGGFYRETYRSPQMIPEAALGPQYTGTRAASTAIYFLVTHDSPSNFHRLMTDELWHHYQGGVLELVMIHEDGRLESRFLGHDAGAFPQVCMPAGVWFGARMVDGAHFALCGCTMAPGFDFEDFELASRSALSSVYPQHRAIIAGLTREE